MYIDLMAQKTITGEFITFHCCLKNSKQEGESVKTRVQRCAASDASYSVHIVMDTDKSPACVL